VGCSGFRVKGVPEYRFVRGRKKEKQVVGLVFPSSFPRKIEGLPVCFTVCAKSVSLLLDHDTTY